MADAGGLNPPDPAGIVWVRVPPRARGVSSSRCTRRMARPVHVGRVPGSPHGRGLLQCGERSGVDNAREQYKIDVVSGDRAFFVSECVRDRCGEKDRWSRAVSRSRSSLPGWVWCKVRFHIGRPSTADRRPPTTASRQSSVSGVTSRLEVGSISDMSGGWVTCRIRRGDVFVMAAQTIGGRPRRVSRHTVDQRIG